MRSPATPTPREPRTTPSVALRMRRMLLLISSTALIGGAVVSGTLLSGCNSGGSSSATLPATPTSTLPPDMTATVGLNEVFDFGGLKIKFTEIVDPLTSSESSYIPLPGNRFVGAGFEATNPTSQPRPFSPAAEVNLVDQQGGRYAILLGQRPDDFLGQELKPGATLRGRLSFEMPDGRVPTMIELRRQGLGAVNVKLAAA